MAYCGFVTTIKNLRPHPNADRLDLGECFGNTVCVGRWEYAEGDVIVYFPTDGQLSEEFCTKHDLVRRKDENGNPAGGYLEPGKRNIRAINLRGQKSDGLVMPLRCLEYTGVDMATMTVGTPITVVNGHEICCKYIPRTNVRGDHSRNGNKTRKHKEPIAPLFAEHADTEQLAYNLSAFKPGDEIEISLKMHGTSTRTGYLPILKGYKRTILDRLLRRTGKPIYEYDYISGTRRVVLDSFEGGFYGSNEFREPHCEVFHGKLNRGETVYAEIVGFTTSGNPIMSSCDNKKLNNKEFVKQYGSTTTFSYGCSPSGEDGLPQSDLYVYRMTMTNEDGYVVEYTPDFMRYRCEQMGVKCVPVFYRGFIPETEDRIYVDRNENGECDEGETAYVMPTNSGEWVKNLAEQFYDGADPIGKTHVREGVVVRIINRPKFCAYKHKNFSFKILSNIAVADAEASGATEGMSEDILAEM